MELWHEDSVCRRSGAQRECCKVPEWGLAGGAGTWGHPMGTSPGSLCLERNESGVGEGMWSCGVL